MRHKAKLSEMPSTILVAADREPYEPQRLELVEQIAILQAYLKAERLKSARLELKLQGTAKSGKSSYTGGTRSQAA